MQNICFLIYSADFKMTRCDVVFQNQASITSGFTKKEHFTFKTLSHNTSLNCWVYSIQIGSLLLNK